MHCKILPQELQRCVSMLINWMKQNLLQLSCKRSNKEEKEKEEPSPSCLLCHLSCLCKCISSLKFLAMAANQLGCVTAFPENGREKGHSYTCTLLSLVSFGKLQLTVERFFRRFFLNYIFYMVGSFWILEQTI